MKWYLPIKTPPNLNAVISRSQVNLYLLITTRVLHQWGNLSCDGHVYVMVQSYESYDDELKKTNRNDLVIWSLFEITSSMNSKIWALSSWDAIITSWFRWWRSKQNDCTYSHIIANHWGHYNVTLPELLLYDQHQSLHAWPQEVTCLFQQIWLLHLSVLSVNIKYGMAGHLKQI